MQVLPLPETLALFVVILGVLVLVHEFGHFITAKRFGVEAPEFGIGFPPRVATLYKSPGWIEIQGKRIRIPADFKLPPGPAATAFGSTGDQPAPDPATILTIGSYVTYKTRQEKGREILTELHVVPEESAAANFASQVQNIDRGTAFTVNALPVGGFVRLSGEDDPTAPNALAARPSWQRAIVLVAGVTMNFILALLAFFVLEAAFPRPIVAATTQVVGFPQGVDSPAAQAGVRVGDVIVSINGVNVKNNRQAMLEQIQPSCGHEVALGVERPDPRAGVQNLTLRLVPQPSADLPCAVGVVIQTAIGERITSVAPGSLAAQIGLRPGDGLAQVGDLQLVPPATGPNVEMKSVQDLAAFVESHSKVRTTLPVIAIRDGVPLPSLKVTIPENVGPQEANLGLGLSPYMTAPEAGGEALAQMGTALALVPRSLVGMIGSLARGQDSGVGGPIRIAQAVAEGTPSGGLPFIVFLFGTLSLNLAVLNLLPFPGLDGGRLAFVVLEVLRGGRKIDPRVEGLVHLIGIMVLLAFILFVSYNDVLRLLAGKSAFAP